jgi:DNA-binding MarR family transcriptional regulator
LTIEIRRAYAPVMVESNVFDDAALPTLLGAARRTYGDAIRRALDAAGMSDLPGRGSLLVGTIPRGGTPLQVLPTQMGVSKQAVSQVVDALVDRGYLSRAADPADRRRLMITLTARGRDAAKVARRTVANVDRRLAGKVAARDLAAMRRVLVTLASL